METSIATINFQVLCFFAEYHLGGVFVCHPSWKDIPVKLDHFHLVMTSWKYLGKFAQEKEQTWY